MEKEEAKKLLSNVLYELEGEESERPKGDGITSEEYIHDAILEVYSYYFCN